MRRTPHKATPCSLGTVPGTVPRLAGRVSSDVILRLLIANEKMRKDARLRRRVFTVSFDASALSLSDMDTPHNSDYEYISSQHKTQKTGLTDNNPSKTIKQCLHYHLNKITSNAAPRTKEYHYRFVKIIEQLLIEHVMAFKEVIRLFKAHGGHTTGQRARRTRIKDTLFSGEHGIPCYIAVMHDVGSIYHQENQTPTFIINRSAPQSLLLKHYIRANTEDAQYIFELRSALKKAMKANHGKAKTINSQIAVKLNKQFANAMKISSRQQRGELGFYRIDEEKSNAFDAQIKKCAGYAPDMDSLKLALKAKSTRIAESIRKSTKLLSDPNLPPQKQHMLKISIAKEKMQLLKMTRNHKQILHRRRNYLIRHNKKIVKQTLDKMNAGGVGAFRCVTPQCKRFVELYVQSKTDALEADERRKYDRIALTHGSTTRSEIEMLCYRYAAACKYLECPTLDVDPTLALKTVLAHPQEMELLSIEVVDEGIFSMSLTSVSEFAHQGRRQTTQAKRCRDRGSMNIAFKNKAKIIKSRLHPNHELARASLTQRQLSIARLPQQQQEETVSSSQDCGAIRKFGTHEGNDARRNRRSLHLIGSLFGLPASSVYANPKTYIRPTVTVLNQGIYDPTTGIDIRAAEFRDQYVTVAPKTIAYGNAMDMFNQYEHVLTTMTDFIKDDKSDFKDGAVEKKSHALSLSKEKFTFKTYKYQISFLKFLCRARLLKELL